jgi:hypothetical protein
MNTGLTQNDRRERWMTPVNDAPSVLEGKCAEQGDELKDTSVHGSLRPILTLGHCSR